MKFPPSPKKPPREIVWTKQFQKDYRDAVGKDPRKENDFKEVLYYLTHRILMPANKNDHLLKGNLKGCRDCHVRGDLVLLYCIEPDDVVKLLRIGSHSKLRIG